MTEEQIALARRAVACPKWRWMPGMLTTDDERMSDEGWPDYEVTDFGASSVVETVEWRDRAKRTSLPDLQDPATLGCLLALVREALKSEDRLWGGRVEVHQDSHCLFVVVSPEHDPNGFLYHRWISSGTSEVESLVAALEAAP